MSAVSGATNLTVAECLQVAALKDVSLRALDEALAVAASEGIELSKDETLAGLELISESGGTGDNKSSLCVDILNQRPTEVDYIYGKCYKGSSGRIHSCANTRNSCINCKGSRKSLYG